MKKTDKKTLSLSTQTLRNLRADELTSASGGLPPGTMNYSICWTCGRDGCTKTGSMIIGAC